MHTPLLSIIIPALNEEKCLPILLADIKKQKTKNFEVILVDGESEDDTVKKAKMFLNSFPFSIYSCSKRDVSVQKNLGASHATGQYIVFLDADSRLPAGFTTNAAKEIAKYKHLVFLPHTYPLTKSPTDKLMFNIVNFFVDLSQNMGKPLPSVGSMIFERHFFTFLGGYRSGHAEDHDIILRTKQYGVTGKYAKSVRVGYSLRRYEHEGTINVAMKNFISTIQMTFRGRIVRQLFEYEMGGQHYKSTELKKNMVRDVRRQNQRNILLRFSRRLSQLLLED